MVQRLCRNIKLKLVELSFLLLKELCRFYQAICFWSVNLIYAETFQVNFRYVNSVMIRAAPSKDFINLVGTVLDKCRKLLRAGECKMLNIIEVSMNFQPEYH